MKGKAGPRRKVAAGSPGPGVPAPGATAAELPPPPPASPPDSPAAEPKPRVGRLAAALLQPEKLDPQALRLGGGLLLAAWSLLLFRGAAAPLLVECVATAAAVLGLLWAGFRRLGWRPLGNYHPGPLRGMATALLLYAVLPPGIPPALAAGLVALAVVVEGRLRQAAFPLALGGTGAAWAVACLWHARAGLPYVAPFDLHPLDDPVRLWSQFGLAVDPARLYAGNVAGPVGATSLGAVALVVVALGYAGELAWEYVVAFFAAVAAAAMLVGEPPTVALAEGPALVFAGVLGAERRRLPHTRAWRVVPGALAGGVAVAAAHAGLGVDAYGIGFLAAAASVSGAQLLRLTDPASWSAARVRAGGRPEQVASLALVLPLGWLLVGRDGGLEAAGRRRLILVSLAVFVLTGALALAWVYYLRLPR